MTVVELIEKLKELPQNMEVIVWSNGLPSDPNPEQVWDDEQENFVVIL